jgi:NADH-quinone oxidoreductase subunit G
MVTRQLVDAVPFYAGLTLEEIGGKGVRWPARESAASFPEAPLGPFELEAPEPAAQPNGRLRLGTFRSIWASEEVQVSPALRFLHPGQHLEISPADAQRLSVFQGERVVVGADGTHIAATVNVRSAVPPGSVFLQSGVPAESASSLTGALVEVRKA